MAKEKTAKKAVKTAPETQVKPEAPKEKAAAAPAKEVSAVKQPSDVKAPSEIQTKPEVTKPEAPKAVDKPEIPKAVEKAIKEPAKIAPEAQVKPEAPKAEVKAQAKKEADPSKEFVDGIMAEMSLKGASKKRLIKKLAEQYNFDKQRVMFRLKRALITERYAAVVAAGGH